MCGGGDVEMYGGDGREREDNRMRIKKGKEGGAGVERRKGRLLLLRRKLSRQRW